MYRGRYPGATRILRIVKTRNLLIASVITAFVILLAGTIYFIVGLNAGGLTPSG